jgi:hypothetical protein
VSHEQLRHDPDTFEIIGVQASAFQIRPTIEKYLSAAWAEHFPGNHDEQVVAAGRDVANRIRGRDLDGSAFAIGNVANIKADGRSQSSVDIEVLLSGNPRNPPHAEVWGIALEDEALQLLLAVHSWSRVIAARDV